MKLGYLSLEEAGETNRLLVEAAERLTQSGFALAGAVQINVPRTDRSRSDMMLQVLGSERLLKISVDNGAGAKGCRLDTSALEAAVMLVAAKMPQAQGLIVNKFGKQEAEGRGFAGLVTDALSRGLPVLCGVAPVQRAGFERFAEGLAVALPPDAKAIAAWMRGEEGHG